MSKTILNLFVDREHIHRSFMDMLAASSEKQLMLIKAEGGMGKSWLVAKLRHECSVHAPPVAYTALDFKDGQAHDYLSLVRRARDDLGAARFNSLTQAINAATGLQINLHSKTEVSGQVRAELGDATDSEIIVAGGHVFKDNFFQIQADSESTRREAEASITAAFFECLRKIIPGETVIFFLDTYEKAPASTRHWIENQFLLQIREGTLPRTIVIITGREIPEIDISWKHCAIRPKLEALESRDVAAYLHDKRGLTDADANTLYRASKGNPQLLGMLADNIDASQNDDDDW